MSDSTKSTPALVEKFVIRLPNGLREQIKALSEQNRRSMNSEIIMVLEKHIQQFIQADAKEFATSEILSDDVKDAAEGRETTQVLQKRLDELPPEKKEALLELLG